MSNKTKLTDETLGNNTITGPNLAPANLTDADISPNVGLNITTPNLASSLDLSSKSLTLPNSSLAPFTVNSATQAFNIGLLGFKQAVNNGLTVFNLVDGVVDEFHDETGIDTPENSNASYDSTDDFYGNQSSQSIELLLTTNNAFFSNPSHAPLVTYNAQVVGATEAQAMADTTAPGSMDSDDNYYKAMQLTSFATVTWPAVATEVTATIVGGGGSSLYAPVNHSGAGGAVKATISDPEMASETWDIMVAGGGYVSDGEGNPNSQYPTGGIGGGGMGVHSAGGGASVIFNGEATINPGVFYGVDDTAPSPFSNPYGSPPQGIGYGGTATPGSAPKTVLAIGGAASEVNNAEEEGYISGDFSQGRDGSGGTSNPRVNYPQSPGYHGGGGRGPTTPFDPSPTTPAVGGMGSGQTGSNTAGGDGVNWPQQFFRGAGAYNPPSPGQYEMGGGGSGYRGGGGGYNSGAGQTGKSGAGAGFHDTSIVPAPSITNAPNPYPQASSNSESAFKADLYPTLPTSGKSLFDTNAPEVGDGSNDSKSGDYPLNGSDGAVFLQFQGQTTNSSMTLISDTFTALSVPTTARIVVFGELPDGTSDFTVSATRDNTTFNTITLTDEGFQAGSSGIKIFTGSTPLTGTASPQVALRWKVVGSSLTGANKIHGVALQWA